MSEIKHQFTGGKMNKDLDERLVPNGEYRDAMNIQVSTSEGSDVGAVQNILGNQLGCSTDITPVGSVTVGSVSDEKNDSLYWLVAGPILGGTSLATLTAGGNPYYAKDMIMRRTASGCEPVLVDQWASIFSNYDVANSTYWASTNDNSIVLSDTAFLEHIQLGMSVYGINSDGTITPQTRTVTNIGNLQSITTPYSIGVDASVTTTLTQSTPTPITRFVATILPNAQGAYSAVMDVIFIQNTNSIPGGIQIGDYITSQVDYYGVYAMSSAQVIAILGGGLFQIDTPLATTSATITPPLTTLLVGSDGVDYYPYYLGVTGTNGSSTIDRTSQPLTNEIILPTNSQWLNEIADLFWDENLVAIASPPTLEVSPNVNWPNGGCISPSSVNVPVLSSGTLVYDNIFRVVDCTAYAAIMPSSAIPHSITLTVPISEGEFNNQTITLDGPLHLGAGFEYLHFSSDRVLNFSASRLITGINIIDDMLFWVDGREDTSGVSKVIGTEPKKINIKRSIRGTDLNGNLHTKLINDNTSVTGPALKEEHITVIRTAPKTALSFDLITDRDLDKNYSGIMNICSSSGPNISSFTSTSQNRRDFSSLEEGDIFRTTIDTDIDGNDAFGLPTWKVGTRVVLKEFDEAVTPAIPFTENEYRIKGVIVNWSGNKIVGTTGDPAQVSIKVTSIIGFPPTTSTTLNYAVDTYFETAKLFEFKFPRFSYRYKYRDGEYSTFAPFTEVAFAPGNFNYHPTKGYNLGMTNTITSLIIRGFVTQDIPSDVVGIDLLYKEDASPNVYTIDTLKPNDQVLSGAAFNNWDSNAYEITHDTIHSVVPANQLLRPWDNVPRKALAQEVTGNRIVYGNYLQNYDLTVNNQDFYPEFSLYVAETKSAPTVRSIKSLRDYQLGVVFTDEYGRETPVITNSSGTFKVPKSDANKSNALSVGFNGNGPPVDLEYFKFFVKETSGEYYNMAMDRFFNADDGNYWLSFPSSDRNKIDEDTFLILKKGHDSKELVGDKARYKVLAIENEAPDFIKTSHYNIGQVKQQDNNLFSSLVNAPTETKDYFNITSQPFESGSASDMHKIEDPLYVEFGLTWSSKVSNRYRITELTKPDGGSTFNIKIDGSFGSDVNFISNGSEIIDGAVIRFYKYQVENKPIFDGRFFVKILNDEVFKKNIAVEDVGDKEYIVSAEKKIYFMSGDHISRHNASGTAGTFGANANINDSYDSAGAQTLTNFQHGSSSSSSTSQNWYYYETYFKNKFYISPASGSLHTKHRGADKIFEDVMFIDRGFTSGNHGHSGPFRFQQLNNTTSSQGIGVKNYTNIGRMDLSFGSIEPEENEKRLYNGSGSVDVIAANGKYHTSTWDENWESGGEGAGFWDLTSTDRKKYNHLAPIYDKIQSGQQFRWKEDPMQTIYTITQQVDNYNVVRFDNTTEGSYVYNGGDINDYYGERDSNGLLVKHGTPYTLASNFQQKKRFWFTPAMSAWDPTNQDSLGPITGGAKVDVSVSDWGDPTNNQTILAGTAVTGRPNTITIFESTFDNTYDTVNGVRWQIEEGMILTHIGISGTLTALDKPVLVDSIFRDNLANASYIISFKGYQGTSGEVTIGALTNVYVTGQALVFKQPAMNGLSVNSANNISDFNSGTSDGIGAVGYTMEFIEVKDGDNELPPNPAIWETEPKESTDLDIYYEISGSNPINLNPSTIKTVLPVGSKVSSTNGGGSSALTIIGNNSIAGDTIILSQALCANAGGCYDKAGNLISGVTPGVILYVERPSGTGIEVEVDEVLEISGSGYSRVFRLKNSLYNTSYTLNWHNCYAFGNGVESNRIRDTFNLPFITNGVKASTTFEENYREEHRKYGLIYSGIYNSNSGVNNLNQFIQAEKITKDINPIYGSIQKLHSRSAADGDLIVLCEDRVLKILADKDALYNADGNSQLIANNNVLGQTIPYSGDYGISKNPESFASESYRVYFTDKVRGAVVRLSKDGLTQISDHGMKDWFRDNLKLSTKLIGSYDDRNDEYNITLDNSVDNIPKTVSFKEDVRGWVSFKSFTPENGISCANEYYTFNNGKLWQHNDEDQDRNTFYKVYSDDGFTPSSINVILNESPGSIKTFHTLNYEGSQSKVETFTDYNTYFPGTTVVSGSTYNNEYYNLEPKDGWKVQNISTDQEEGSINEFIEKEGKWFNYIKGKVGSATNTTLNDGSITSGLDNADFSFQGLGVLPSTATTSNLLGCTANGLLVNASGVVNDYFGDGVTAYNYSSIATIEDGSCIATEYGCMDPLADGGNNCECNGNFPNTDDGSCIYEGCTTLESTNYDSNANADDGSCIPFVYGCTTIGQFNYNVANNVNQVSATDTSNPCVPVILGCINDANATNFAGINNLNGVNPPANTDDGNCEYVYYGCVDTVACNWLDPATLYGNPVTVLTDNSCVYCGDTTADNEDGASCNDGCLYCLLGTSFGLAYTASPDVEIALQWNHSVDSTAASVVNYEITYVNDTTSVSTTTTVAYNGGGVPQYHTISGLTQSTTYYVSITAVCGSSQSTTSTVHTTTGVTPIYGCTDPNATNENPLANTEDGSCTYTGCTDNDPLTSLNGATFFNHPNPGSFYTNPIQATISDGSCVTVINGCTDSIAINFDSTANVDDSSCTYPTYGCMDTSLNNAGTAIAATNYGVQYNSPVGFAATIPTACTYAMPELWTGNDQGTQSSLLGVTGWRSGGVWANHRRLWAIWDVSNAPKIKGTVPGDIQFAYLQGATTSNYPGNITSFNNPNHIWYSNDDTANWLAISNWIEGDPIKLIRIQYANSGKVAFTGSSYSNAVNYPPQVTSGYTGEQQAARFSFIDPNIPASDTPIATYNVTLGCNDATASNYVAPISFYDDAVQCNYPYTTGVTTFTGSTSPSFTTSTQPGVFVNTITNVSLTYTPAIPINLNPVGYEYQAQYIADGAAYGVQADFTTFFPVQGYQGAGYNSFLFSSNLVFGLSTTTTFNPSGRIIHIRARALSALATASQSGSTPAIPIGGWVDSWSLIP